MDYKKKIYHNLQYNTYICLFLFFSTLIVFWQVKDFDFISLDDPAYVRDNFNVTSGISIKNLRTAFRFYQVGDHTYYHPLTWISHMLDCQLFGLSPGAHHLSNVFYHIFNSCLLFFMLWLMTGKRWQSAFVAAIFALHPLNVESVAWISERKNLLSTSFWFLTILAYMNYIKKRSLLRYLLIIICMLLGLLTKPMLITIPFVLLLLDLWPLNQIIHPESSSENQSFFQDLFDFFRRNVYLLFEKIPLFMLSTAWSFLSTTSNQYIGSIISSKIVPMDLRIANAIVSYVRYLFKMIWPANLSFFYPYPSEMLPTWQIVGSAVFIILVSILFFQKWKQRPWLIVGWLWYLGVLFPVSGIIINGLWPAIADRWSYVPLIGIFMIIAWEVKLFADKHRFQKTWLSVTFFFFSIFLMVTTWKQVQTWKNSSTVFKHALSVTKSNSVAHNYLGHELEFNNDKNCIQHFTEAIRISPYWAQPHFGLAKFMKSQNQIKQAVFHYQKAIQLNPEFALAYADLGRVFMDQNKTTAALYCFLQAVKFQPDFYMVYNEIGKLYKNQGNPGQSIEYFKKAIQINTEDEIIYYNLATTLTEQGNISEAIPYYLDAIRLKPNFAEAHNGVGASYLKNNDLKNAINHYKEAIRIKPDFADAENNLATALISEGNISEAILHISNSIHRNPTFAASYNTMGMAMAAQQNDTEAIKYYAEAIRLDPSFFIAYNNLGILYFKQNKLETALHYFQSAYEKMPGNSEIEKNLDLIKNTLRKTNRSIKEIKSLVSNDPENSILYYQLGRLYQKKEDYDSAIIQYNKAISLNDKFVNALIELAQTYKKQNQFSEAIIFFEKSISLEPDNASLYHEIIRLYSKQNMIEDAIKWLKKTIDKGLINWQVIETDNEFQNIRHTHEHQKLLTDHGEKVKNNTNTIISTSDN